jgi:hypothetical protein
MPVTPVVLGGLFTEYRVTKIAVFVFDGTFVAHYLVHVGCPGILGDEVTIGCWTWIVVWVGVVVSSVDLGLQSLDPVGDLSWVIRFLQQISMVVFHVEKGLLFGHDRFVSTPLTLPHVVEDSPCQNSCE